jgi:SNF2 family DNA or RNA helicase
MEFRDYQLEIIQKAKTLLEKDRFVYLAMEVRTGKTLTSLGVSALLPVKNLLFITKKKAISSIESDYKMLNPSYAITVINYESLHKIEQIGWDMVVCDEAHGMGAFPKRNKRSTQVKSLIIENNPYVIFLSGTPTPESYSQMFHQVSVMRNHPFNEFKTFYKFAHKYVNVKQRKINSFLINDYSEGLDIIISEMKPHTLAYTQKEAGFKVQTTEHVIEVDMLPITYQLADKLKKDLVVEGKDDVILADTPVKLMMKLHQMYSGTVKFESGKSMILDYSKAQFIHDNFLDIKIGIFYKFKEELNALKEIYGDDLCTDLETFNTTDKSIALQIVSGREGISLKEAKILVYYNIDFSATSYWQSRDRMTTKERLKNDVYWIFSRGGIEADIYKAVTKKKDYTLRHFNKDNKL